MADETTKDSGGLSRADFLKRSGAAVGGVVLGDVAAQPAWARPRNPEAFDAAATIKIGFVSPLTGPAAGFGEPDPYVIGLARTAFAKGLTVGGKRYGVQILEKDSQSVPATAAQVAQQLISSSQVDLMLATSTPEVVNPVADAAEAAGVPCISTTVPWEAWYFGRGAKPGQPSPFKWTFHFCFRVQQFFLAYTTLWPEEI